MFDKRILVVEDDALNALYFKEVLESKGYQVVGIAESSEMALDITHKLLPDLILMDIGLKGKTNGIETAKELKKFSIPVVFLTANNNKEVYQKAREVKPAGYIIKPVDETELLNVVDLAFAKKGKQISKEVYLKELQKKYIIEEIGERPFLFFEQYYNKNIKKTLVVSTTTRFNIQNQHEESFDTIINLQKTNNIKRVNKFFESVNGKLPNGGIFIGHAETKGLKKKMILEKHPPVINYLFYIIYFCYKRIWPKLPLFKKIYFVLTKGRNRAMSRAEVLGRLYSCGFEVLEESFIDSNLHFVARKIKEPSYDMHASYDLIFKMKRVGKNGKIIHVYKFRTMHPYAEYLQDYILKHNGYSEIGKPAHDFRLTTWGRFMRRYWLDELPQLINVLKGEMKLVGIRPLSQRFLQEYPEEVLKLRLKHKPGCVPPYVALLKQEVSEYIESEKTYLLEKEKNPYTTDIKYFFKAIYNIITNKIRSA